MVRAPAFLHVARVPWSRLGLRGECAVGALVALGPGPSPGLCRGWGGGFPDTRPVPQPRSGRLASLASFSSLSGGCVQGAGGRWRRSRLNRAPLQASHDLHPLLPFPGPCSRRAEPLASLHSGDLGFEQPPLLDSAPWREQGGTRWTRARTQTRQWQEQGSFWNPPRR